MDLKELREYVEDSINRDYYALTWADFFEDKKTIAEFQEKKRQASILLDKVEKFEEIEELPDFIDNEYFREEVKSIIRSEQDE